MPIDVFAATGINPSAQQETSPRGPKDVFAESGINPNGQSMAQVNAQQATPQQGYAQQIINQIMQPKNNIPGDVLAGLGQLGRGLLNAPHNLISNAIPNAVNPSYNYSAGAGVPNPTTIDKFVQGLTQYSPYALGGEALGATKLASTIPGWIASQAAPGIAYGATQSATPLKTGSELAALNVALGALPLGIGKGFNTINNAINPNTYTQGILDNLGQGATSLEENAKALASSVKMASDNAKENGSVPFNTLSNIFGNSSLYDELSKSEQQYPTVDKSVIDSFTNKVGKIHDAFTENPTFDNAHELQSEIGASIRAAQKKPMTLADSKTVDKWQDAQDSLLNDIDSFLQKNGPSGNENYFSDLYKNGRQNWLENVVPYKEDTSISALASGKITNPDNISSIFKSPEPSTLKVLQDIGPEANKRIIFNELGRSNYQNNPQGLINATDKLYDKGLGSYIPPELSDQINSLKTRLKIQNSLGTLGSMGAGAGLLHAFGIPPEVSTIAGGLGGAAFAPIISKAAGNTGLSTNLVEQIGRLLNKAYIVPKTAAVSAAAQGANQ